MTVQPMRKNIEMGVAGLSLALGLSACAHTMPCDSPVVERVLAEKALRVQIIERGAADSEFVHEILHQLGQGSEGNQRLARLLAEHLHHHADTAQAVFQELAQHRGFQDWVVERLRGRKETTGRPDRLP
jgi:hypothetical protein